MIKKAITSPQKNKAQNFCAFVPLWQKAVRVGAAVFIVSIIIPFFSCKTTGKNNPYGRAYTFKDSSLKLQESDKAIDNYKTHEIYFTLSKQVKCISLTISSVYISDRIDRKKKIIKSYYILESMIDIRKFKNEKNYSFSELERNFDYEWKRKHLLVICNRDSDPIYRLKKGRLYRIRFTAFINKETEYSITVSSPGAVTFYKTFEEYKKTLEKPQDKK